MSPGLPCGQRGGREFGEGLAHLDRTLTPATLGEFDSIGERATIPRVAGLLLGGLGRPHPLCRGDTQGMLNGCVDTNRLVRAVVVGDVEDGHGWE